MASRGLLLVTVFIIGMASLALAETPNSSQQYCEIHRDPDRIRAMALDDANLLSFTNHGGLANGGVCWWHSRFQRAALYLAIYRPDLPRPTTDEAKRIIKNIASRDQVVTVPGYANLRAFSADFDDLIQSQLEHWQRTDGFLGGSWIDGLQGRTHLPAAEFSQKMDALYSEVQGSRRIVYQKLQVPGIAAHAWLVVNMVRTVQGYDLTVLDSNSIGPRTYVYRRGMTAFQGSFGEMVPYTRQEKELEKMEARAKQFCGI